MNKRLFTNPLFLVLLSFAIGSSILVHHYATWHRVVDLADMLHHEFFAFTIIAFGIGILVTLLIPLWGRRYG